MSFCISSVFFPRIRHDHHLTIKRISTNTLLFLSQHGSDTGAFDSEGRYIPQKFDEIFQKYSSSPNRDGLSKGDVFRAIMAQRSVNDFIGLGGEVFEWTTTYILLWPADGVMKYEDVRACMDGSIFWKIARERGVDLKGADPARTTGKH
jgi:peroxygenase